MIIKKEIQQFLEQFVENVSVVKNNNKALINEVNFKDNCSNLEYL